MIKYSKVLGDSAPRLFTNDKKETTMKEIRSKPCKSTEWCSNCEEEVETTLVMEDCPVCGEPVVACNSCGTNYQEESCRCRWCGDGSNWWEKGTEQTVNPRLLTENQPDVIMGKPWKLKSIKGCVLVTEVIDTPPLGTLSYEVIPEDSGFYTLYLVSVINGKRDAKVIASHLTTLTDARIRYQEHLQYLLRLANSDQFGLDEALVFENGKLKCRKDNE